MKMAVVWQILRDSSRERFECAVKKTKILSSGRWENRKIRIHRGKMFFFYTGSSSYFVLDLQNGRSMKKSNFVFLMKIFCWFFKISCWIVVVLHKMVSPIPVFQTLIQVDWFRFLLTKQKILCFHLGRSISRSDFRETKK